METYKRFQTKRHAEVTEIRLLDRILSDMAVLSELSDEFIDFANNNNPSRVVVSFANVDYCGTATITALIGLRKEITAAGGLLTLCEMSPAIRDAFRCLNLDGTLFTIHDSIDEAFHSLV
jgi:anti-anti-sigma factor